MPDHYAMGNTFAADPGKCAGCGLCVADCPAGCLDLSAGKAAARPEAADDCIGCQHCLAICPEAAVSILGLKPEDSAPLRGARPDYANLEALVLGRRSFRQFSPEPVDLATLGRVLHAAARAPTGVNARGCRLTVIHNPEAMAEYRDRTARALLAAAAGLPEETAWLADLAREWVEKGRDELYRGAPHLIVASTAPDSTCPKEDALIALSYFDLLAQAHGIGTVWGGIPFGVISCVPEARAWLGIPPDHAVGYAMMFGKPAIRYVRSVQHKTADIAILSGLEGGKRTP